MEASQFLSICQDIQYTLPTLLKLLLIARRRPFSKYTYASQVILSAKPNWNSCLPEVHCDREFYKRTDTQQKNSICNGATAVLSLVCHVHIMWSKAIQ